jgi:phosphoglycolate phosphatase
MFVIFDLDGTVWDSARGIVGCIGECFENFDLEVPPEAASREALGPPLRDMLSVLGMPDALLDAAVADYRTRYHDWGAFAADLYDGIVDTLDVLAGDGYRLATATSKGETGTELMLDHFGLRDRFEFVGAATADGLVTTKAAVLSRTLAGLGDPPAGDCIMVGDRHHDVLGAAEHGIGCIGVAWGYGSEEELAEAGALAIAQVPAEVPRLATRR